MDWSYVAGFFDGEGTAVSHEGARPSLHLSMVNTNEEVMRRIHGFLGCGHIYIRHRSGRHQTCFTLEVTAWMDVLKTAEALQPHVIVKRHALSKLIFTIKNHDWRSHRLTNSDEETICHDYAGGEIIITDIARHYRVSSDTIRRLLKKRGIHIYHNSVHARAMRRKLDTIDPKRVEEIYRRGGNGLINTAKAFSVSQWFMRDFLVKHEIPIREASQLWDPKVVDITEDYWVRGRTLRQIAKDRGVALRTVQRFVRRHTIPMRPMPPQLARYQANIKGEGEANVSHPNIHASPSKV